MKRGTPLKKACISLLLALAATQLRDPIHATETPRSAPELLACSIDYHDPDALWAEGAFEFTDVSSRPDGTIGRRTVLRVDNSMGHIGLDTHVDGHVISVEFVGDNITDLRLDGNSEPSEDDVNRFQLTEAQIRSRRNMFLYLLGLPMKLRDAGTQLAPEIKATSFEGRTVSELRVTYDQRVGTDTWSFYIDPQTCALVGHRFHHGTAATDGEFTILSGEVQGQGLRLPRVRQWHRNSDGKWFITHTLESISPPTRTAPNAQDVPPNPSLERTPPG